MQFYLLFPLLLRARRLLSGPLGLVLLYSACAFMSFWDWQVRQPDWNSNLPALIFFGRYTFYFVFGMFLAGFSPESWSAKRLAGFALLFLLSVAAQSVAVGQFFIGQNYALAAFFASLSLAAVLKGAAPRVFSAVRQMGKDSLWIYFVHPLAIYLAQGIVPLKDGVIAYAEDALAAIALSCASVWAAHRVLGRAKGQAGSAAVPPASA